MKSEPERERERKGERDGQRQIQRDRVDNLYAKQQENYLLNYDRLIL